MKQWFRLTTNDPESNTAEKKMTKTTPRNQVPTGHTRPTKRVSRRQRGQSATYRPFEDYQRAAEELKLTGRSTGIIKSNSSDVFQEAAAAPEGRGAFENAADAAGSANYSSPNADARVRAIKVKSSSSTSVPLHQGCIRSPQCQRPHKHPGHCKRQAGGCKYQVHLAHEQRGTTRSLPLLHKRGLICSLGTLPQRAPRKKKMVPKDTILLQLERPLHTSSSSTNHTFLASCPKQNHYAHSIDAPDILFQKNFQSFSKNTLRIFVVDWI